MTQRQTDERSAPSHLVFGGGVATPPVVAGQVGAKAWGLIEMCSLGLPVPAGVVLPIGVTEGQLDAAVRAALADLERISGRRLGDRRRPLLVSVRSGASVSMPGMMDTLLDVGVTADVLEELGRQGGDEFAQDTLRRFRQGWARAIGGEPPSGPVEQVIEAARGVLRSWDGERALTFREHEGIEGAVGTAVTIQAMVFGNRGADSGTGVVFSRDPSTGAPGMVGDLLVDAQGDEVVGGGHSTLPLSELARWPSVHRELAAAIEVLERHHGDMVDVEFTVERGRLFLLQRRPGRRSAAAAARIAVDMADDPSFQLDRAGAVARCRHLLAGAGGPTGAPAVPLDDRDVVVRGMAASPGCGTGVLVVTDDEALRRHGAGEQVVLARPETSPADVAAMAVASGIVTTRGGIVSHAAVVARSWGVPAVVGAVGMEVEERGVVAGGRSVQVGELVTVDGDHGTLLIGSHDGAGSEVPELAVLRRWAAELGR